MNFRNDIQGLRALAVIFVFIFHLSNSFLPGGFIGVDIFFVISGYLVSGIILSKMDKNQFKIVDFYESRIKRIVPAYFFLLIITWLGFYFIFINADIGNFKLSHFWATIFNANHFFAGFDDYFGASSTEMPLLHTWTLGVEMQFYLILPLLLFIRNRKYLTILLILFTVLIVCYTSYEIFYNHQKTKMYFSVFARSAEFFIGVLLALTKIERSVLVQRNANLLGIIGLMMMMISLVILNEKSPFPGLYALLPCIAISCLLITPKGIVNDVLSNKAFVYLGEISYSVYLWHWPVMAFWRYYTNRYEFSPIEIFAIVTLTIFASLLSYYLIEKPLRTRSRKIVFAILSLFLVVNILLIYFTTPIKFAQSSTPIEYIYPTFARDSHSDTFKKVGFYGDSTYREKNILLLGDSHALSLVMYLDQLGKKQKIGFRVLTNDSYPSIPGLTDTLIKEKMRLDIYNHLRPYIEEEFDKADVIICFFTGTGINFIDPISKMLNSLRDNQRILFMQDYPVLDINPMRINRSHVKNKKLNYTYKTSKTNLDERVVNLILKYPNTRIIKLDAFNYFYDDIPFYKDTLMYYDGGHMNAYGMQKYEEVTGQEFMKYINWAIND